MNAAHFTNFTFALVGALSLLTGISMTESMPLASMLFLGAGFFMFGQNLFQLVEMSPSTVVGLTATAQIGAVYWLIVYGDMITGILFGPFVGINIACLFYTAVTYKPKA